MNVLLDTNILVYSIVTSMPFHQLATSKLLELQATGCDFWISEQIVRETVCAISKENVTKPMFSSRQVVEKVMRTSAQFQTCQETAGTRSIFLSLVELHALRGAKVYDAAIVASMMTAGIEKILTNNPKDFLPMLPEEAVLTLDS